MAKSAWALSWAALLVTVKHTGGECSVLSSEAELCIVCLK